MSRGSSLRTGLPCGVVQTLLHKLPDFSVDSLHTSGDHLTIKLIHLAVSRPRLTVSIVSCFAVGIAVSVISVSIVPVSWAALAAADFIFRLSLPGPVERENRTCVDLLDPDFLVGAFCLELARAKFALDFDEGALLVASPPIGRISPNDDPMPLRASPVFTGFPALPIRVRGSRELRLTTSVEAERIAKTNLLSAGFADVFTGPSVLDAYFDAFLDQFGSARIDSSESGVRSRGIGEDIRCLHQ